MLRLILFYLLSLWIFMPNEDFGLNLTTVVWKSYLYVGYDQVMYAPIVLMVCNLLYLYFIAESFPNIVMIVLCIPINSWMEYQTSYSFWMFAFIFISLLFLHNTSNNYFQYLWFYVLTLISVSNVHYDLVTQSWKPAMLNQDSWVGFKLNLYQYHVHYEEFIMKLLLIV